MCVFSEFLCLRIELKEIPVGYTPLDTKADLWKNFQCDLIVATTTNTHEQQTIQSDEKLDLAIKRDNLFVKCLESLDDKL